MKDHKMFIICCIIFEQHIFILIIFVKNFIILGIEYTNHILFIKTNMYGITKKGPKQISTNQINMKIDQKIMEKGLQENQRFNDTISFC